MVSVLTHHSRLAYLQWAWFLSLQIFQVAWTSLQLQCWLTVCCCCLAEQVCAGLDEAVQSMKLSEVAEVIIQPQYGFGGEQHQAPQASIPANSVLYYTAELVELNKVVSG